MGKIFIPMITKKFTILFGAFVLMMLMLGCKKKSSAPGVNPESKRLTVAENFDVKGFKRKMQVSVKDAERIIYCYKEYLDSKDFIEENGLPMKDDVWILNNQDGRVVVAFECKKALDLLVGYSYKDSKNDIPDFKFVFSVN